MERSTVFILICCLILGITACQGTAENQQDNVEQAAEDTRAKEAGPAFVNIDVATFAEKIKDPNTVLLDVRTPAETDEGIIEGALTIDVSNTEFKEKVGQLDKSKTYLVYCQAGSRSARACGIMSEMGFEDLYNLEGGYSSWQERTEESKE